MYGHVRMVMVIDNQDVNSTGVDRIQKTLPPTLKLLYIQLRDLYPLILFTNTSLVK